MKGVRILEDDKQQNRLIGPLSKKKEKKDWSKSRTRE